MLAGNTNCLGISILILHYRAIFEKYDGVRTLWDPTRRRFFSRYGGELRLPADLIESMPNILLDGELWCVQFRCAIFLTLLGSGVGILVKQAR